MQKKKYIAGIFFADDRVTCGIAAPSGDGIEILDTPHFKTYKTPEEDIEAAATMLSERCNFKDIIALGIAMPGTIINQRKGRDPEGYGLLAEHSRRTSWQSFNPVKKLSSLLPPKVKIPISCLTDAQAFAVGKRYRRIKQQDEHLHKHHPNAKSNMYSNFSLYYLLADEGVSGSLALHSNMPRGEMHTEIGHMRVVRHINDIDVDCLCKNHIDDCVDGLASLRAVKERWNITESRYKKLGKKSEYIERLSYYLSQALVNITMAYMPTQIVIGGRIMNNQHILPSIHRFYKTFLTTPENDSLLYPGYSAQQDINEYITAWSKPNVGIEGCLLLANERRGTEGNIIAFTLNNDS